MAINNEPANYYPEPTSPGEFQGARVIESLRIINIGATDSNGSAYIIGEIAQMCQLQDITLEGAAITAGTGFSVGFTDMQGNVISQTALQGLTDFSTIAGLPLGPLGLPLRHVMGAVTIANSNQRAFEMAGQVVAAFPGLGVTIAKAKYRIVLFATTIGTSGGQFAARVSQRVYG